MIWEKKMKISQMALRPIWKSFTVFNASLNTQHPHYPACVILQSLPITNEIKANFLNLTNKALPSSDSSRADAQGTPHTNDRHHNVWEPAQGIRRERPPGDSNVQQSLGTKALASYFTPEATPITLGLPLSLHYTTRHPLCLLFLLFFQRE